MRSVPGTVDGRCPVHVADVARTHRRHATISPTCLALVASNMNEVSTKSARDDPSEQPSDPARS
ncbi:hypothetical protein VFPBJ_08249 [Purpureocillium lilacinum]|nr:hypothetical protein VFPBJ_08249 [Purpureocillium lilacinum]